VILDSSAILSILLEEEGHKSLLDAIGNADQVLIGAPTLVETAMALTGKLGFDARPLLNEFLEHAGVEVIPFTPAHGVTAIAAFFRYGRGHHPAKLNFGDCMAYAIAAESGLPLLFKGGDFSQTDIVTS
jgi:ribonuclease VapC